MLKPILSLSHFFFFIMLAWTFSLSSCLPQGEIISDDFRPRDSHQSYQESLTWAGLMNSALGRDWKKAADMAIESPLLIETPFAEDFYIDPTEAMANGYRFEAKRGQRVEIEVIAEVEDSVLTFLDVYRIDDDHASMYTHIASSEASRGFIEFEPRSDAEYIVRFQTELLRGGLFRIQIVKEPSLAFPVAGKGNSAIGSLFGAPRDGGRRKHHGIDIFAKRHTPILAPTEGRIRWVGERGLGGRVVWMRDIKRNQTLYFAHLHDILVEDGVYVYPGDTLGTVGNTGNARTTPPHLHFGIYKNGPVDPYHFVANTRTRFKRELADKNLVSHTVRSKRNAQLRIDGITKQSKTISLSKNQIMQVLGTSAQYFRVRLPDYSEGYIAYNDIEKTTRPIERVITQEEDNLLKSPSEVAVMMDKINAGEEVKILGKNEEYQYVERQGGQKGWVRALF